MQEQDNSEPFGSQQEEITPVVSWSPFVASPETQAAPHAATQAAQREPQTAAPAGMPLSAVFEPAAGQPESAAVAAAVACFHVAEGHVGGSMPGTDHAFVPYRVYPVDGFDERFVQDMVRQGFVVLCDESGKSL